MDDRRILDSYPLPIAPGYRRCRNASETRERHDAAYYLFEVYLKVYPEFKSLRADPRFGKLIGRIGFP